MKAILRSIWISLIIFCSSIYGQSDNAVDDLYHYARAHQNDLRLSVYITVGGVQTCLNDEAGRRETISVLRSLGITKAYIETHRSGDIGNAELLKTVRDHFRLNGIAVAGGIATTPGEGFGVRQEGQLEWFNFQHPKTQSDLEKVVRLTAQTFDEMIVDDFLCTADTSDMSAKAKGNKTWSQYRLDLLTDLSENLIVKTAREENPDITIIIKYPQWYDRFHLFGYDVLREPPLYDKVWIGTETRGPATQRMGYVQQYEGYVNFRWISSFAPDKIGGGWFDHIDCDGNDFIDQAYQTVLAGAKEIILFNYFDLMKGHPGHHFLRRQFATLVKLARMVSQQPVRGVYAYKPPQSDTFNEYYIFDYLGMIGIPLIPVGQFPTDPEVIFLPTQAAADPKPIDRIEHLISKGKTVILTAGLLNKIGNNQRLLELAGVRLLKSGEPIKADQLIVEDKLVSFEQGLDLPAKLNPTSAQVLLAAQQDQESLPVFTVNTHPSTGRVFVLNVLTFSEPDFKAIREVLLAPKSITWLNLPVEWLNQIRLAFTFPLGFSLEGIGRVSIHPFGENEWVICNFNNEPVEIDLRTGINSQMEKERIFMNQVTGEKLTSVNQILNLSIDKRKNLWIGAEK